MRKNGNIIMIAPRDEIATREKLDFESRQQISDLEPLVTEQFVLNYQKAADVATLLSGGASAASGASPAQRILSKRGSAIADAQSNMLFVNDIPSKLAEINLFIKQIDIGARQVLIEARVVEASDTFLSDIGVKLSFLSRSALNLGKGVNLGTGTYANPTSSSSATVATEDIVGGTSPGQTVTTTVENKFTPGQQTSPAFTGINLPASSDRAATFALSLFNSSLSNIINMEVSALEQDGLGKVISSPRVVTANNVEAVIEDGTEVPYWKPASGNEPAKLEFKKAKLMLKVTPQITPDRTVKMAIAIEKAEPDWSRSVQGVPPIKSSLVNTNVIVDNGGTIVIGGVFVNASDKTVEKVPLLGDVPFLGNLFKNQKRTTNRRELLIFISPKIVPDRLSMN
jgi:type IV pilus assembly protein PilQ